MCIHHNDSFKKKFGTYCPVGRERVKAKSSGYHYNTGRKNKFLLVAMQFWVILIIEFKSKKIYCRN